MSEATPRGDLAVLVCEACGETLPASEVDSDGGHITMAHDPTCYGGNTCVRICPVPVLCGPVVARVAEGGPGPPNG